MEMVFSETDDNTTECFTIILINIYLNFGNVLAWHGNACASAVSLNHNQPITQNYKSDANA
jgi:hypothetical protein